MMEETEQIILYKELRHTDLLLVYNTQSKHLIINNKTNEELIETIFNFGITKFKQLLSELIKANFFTNENEIRVI